MGEMESKIRLMLIGAVASIAMLAVPAVASASVWQHEGENLSEFAEIKMSGLEIFEGGEGDAMICEVDATMTTEGGGEGLITSFETKACPEGFGTFSTCELATAKARGLPWSVTVNETDLTVAGWHTKRTFTGCATTELDKTIASVTVLLNTPSQIAEMEFLGEEGGYSIFDSMTLEEGIRGTYGIG
jgi:hypothetical protein